MQCNKHSLILCVIYIKKLIFYFILLLNELYGMVCYFKVVSIGILYNKANKNLARANFIYAFWKILRLTFVINLIKLHKKLAITMFFVNVFTC